MLSSDGAAASIAVLIHHRKASLENRLRTPVLAFPRVGGRWRHAETNTSARLSSVRVLFLELGLWSGCAAISEYAPRPTGSRHTAGRPLKLLGMTV